MRKMLSENFSNLSRSLNQASDQLTKYIAAVEAALSELRLGVWASVTVYKYPERVKESGEKSMIMEQRLDLAYGRHGRTWGLLLLSGYDEMWDEETISTSFLREAPRDERAAAVEKLPELLKELERRATAEVKEIQKKADDVKAIATALSNKVA